MECKVLYMTNPQSQNLTYNNIITICYLTYKTFMQGVENTTLKPASVALTASAARSPKVNQAIPLNPQNPQKFLNPTLDPLPRPFHAPDLISVLLQPKLALVDLL